MKEEIHRLEANKINGLVLNNIMNECVYRLEEQGIKKLDKITYKNISYSLEIGRLMKN